MKEEKDRELRPEDLLDTIAQLTVAVQTQNDVLLVLLDQLDVKVPDWKTKDDVEKAVGPKIEMCVKTIREIYGPSKADKS